MVTDSRHTVGCWRMSGEDEPKDIPPLRGISKIFNSYTTQGRVNTVFLTYAGCIVLYLILKNRPKKESKKKT